MIQPKTHEQPAPPSPDRTAGAIASIRVVLADDHPLVRAGIGTAVALNGDVVIVGEAVDGPGALSLCHQLRPDVILLDLNMPGPSPFVTVRRLREECPATQVIVLTAHDDDAYVTGLLRAGIAGYILKDEALDVVASAIRSVVQGGTWFSRSVVTKISDAAIARSRVSAIDLTTREQQLLSILLEGQDVRQIAKTLFLGEQTVRNYLSRLYDKLEVKSRAEAICWARDHRFVSTYASGTDPE